jgi:hypothetical protein
MTSSPRGGAVLSALLVAACGSGSVGGDDGGDGGGDDGPPAPLPAPSCAADGGSAEVAAPVLVASLHDRWQSTWLASPAVVDLDGDGTPEIIAPREDALRVWHADDSIVWGADFDDRVWAPPVVADLVPGRPGLEVAVASRGDVHAFGADGAPLPGFPARWRDEMRSLAAGDVDGDGELELVAVTSDPLDVGSQRDIVAVIAADGSAADSFPANTAGKSGCDDACFVTGGYDQNLAVGDIDGDGVVDIVAPQDNAYVSVHDGTGRAFDAAPIFEDRTKFVGIRFMVDYALAQQGFGAAGDEQGHFTNTAPAIADLDGDGTAEILLLGSVQNVAQNDRERGVGLWVTRHDGTRPAAWTTPVRRPDFLQGLFDWDDVVAITNQVAVADLDPARPGPEIVFAGFDGHVHAVDARGEALWSTPYTTSDTVGTGGVVIADLSRDGVPEVILASYDAARRDAALLVLDAGGNRLHRVGLPGQGATPVPTVADADGDGDLDITVSLRDDADRAAKVLIYEVAGSADNCLPWPTGRGNLRRDGYLPPT